MSGPSIDFIAERLGSMFFKGVVCATAGTFCLVSSTFASDETSLDLRVQAFVFGVFAYDYLIFSTALFDLVQKVKKHKPKLALEFVYTALTNTNSPYPEQLMLIQHTILLRRVPRLCFYR